MLEPCLHLLKQNAMMNGGQEASGSITVKELNWGQEGIEQEFQPPFHFVFGSDIVYEMAAVETLLSTLKILCDHKTVCWLSLEFRDTNVHETFFKNAEEFFSVSKIPKSKLDPQHISEFCTIYTLKKKMD